MTESVKRHKYKILALILALGAALRLFHLGMQSLWLDEAFSVILARRSGEQIVIDTAQDVIPPLYHLILHGFLRLGESEVMVRLVSAFFGFVTIPLIYVVGTHSFNETVGLSSALLLAINPFQIFYSQEARMYSQLGLFGLLAAFFFLRTWQEGKTRNWLAFVLSTVAALYTHNMAFLLLAALGVFALLHWQKARKKWRAWSISLAGILLLFLPWLLYLPGQVARVGGAFWVAKPSVLEVFTTLELFLFGYALPSLVSTVALVVGLYAVFLTLLVGWQARRRGGTHAESLDFFLCLFAVPIAGSFLISLFLPVFLASTLIVSALALYILLAWGLTRTHRAMAGFLVVTGLALTGVSLYNYYANPMYAKPPMREAARYVQERFQPGDTVIHTSDSSYLAFAYYEPELGRHFLTGDPDYEKGTTRARAGWIAGIEPQDLQEIIQGNRRLWLVVALDHNVEYQQQLRDQFDRCFPMLDEGEVGGIQIRLYDLGQGENPCPLR